MARNEIRIRRKPLSASKLARYRNYEGLIARHERDVRIKRLSKLIIYVLIIVILTCTFLGVYIIRQKHNVAPKPVKEDKLSELSMDGDKVERLIVRSQTTLPQRRHKHF
jgi:hypothetical protein